MEEIEFTPSKDKKQYIWVEKYRPTTFDEYLGNPQLKETFKSYVKNRDFCHLFLYGDPGTGKTTVAKLLVKLIPCDYMYINASDENGIDVIRQKIKGFCECSGFKPLKVVIFDECLDENTLVTVLRDGSVIQTEIKNLKDDTDLIKSYNIKLNKIEWRPFCLLDKGFQETYELELENGEIVICTESHKWYVKDKETGNPVKMKLKDIIENNIQEILSF